MTAHNVISTPDGVILVSDTASYSLDGVIRDFMPKSYVNEGRRWGAVFTGSTVAGDFWREKMPDVSFDEARRIIPEVMRRQFAILSEEIGESAHLGVSLAGWSDEDGGWTCCIIKSHGGAPRNFEPFTPYTGGGSISPNPLIGGVERPLTDFELGWNYGQLGYLETMRRVLIAQRRVDLVVTDGRKVPCAIGGQGEAVIITSSGVKRFTLIDWKDEIGEPVEARVARRSAEPVDALLIPSRAERRRFDRHMGRVESKAAPAERIAA